MYEGATRVAAGADSFVSRHGRVPTTDELRAEITLLDGPLSNRIALQRMEALAAQGVPEQVMMDGEAGMAALETALSVLSPEERRSYVESLGPDTRGPARLP